MNNLLIQKKETFEESNNNYKLLTDEILVLKNKLTHLYEKEKKIEELESENNKYKIKITELSIENDKLKKRIDEFNIRLKDIPLTDSKLKEIINTQQNYIDNHINPIIYKDTSILRYHLYNNNNNISLIEELFNELKLKSIRKNDLITFIKLVNKFNLKI